MTYIPLHHKYRPQTFADLVGQEAIATTLSNAIRQTKIAPAYLFTGPRGTGKTSSARILAKSLNCIAYDVPTEQPCGKCDVCRSIALGMALDVIEIDAASNTGVDNIREIIERASYAPVQCRHKVYIIDECHMLSTAAFNSLLKTLEEPPDHVVFILATTDPQRVLPTIISRCQRFDYRRIPLDSMVNHLSNIAKWEEININQGAINLVSQIAQGGLRDAESLLDQLSLLSGEITVERVWDLLGSVPERDLLGMVEAIAQSNTELLIDRLRELVERGKEPLIILQNLASFYRDLLIAKTAPNRHDLVALTQETWQELCELVKSWEINWILAGQKQLKESEVQLKNTTQPRLWLEVTILGLIANNLVTSTVQTITNIAPIPSFNPQQKSTQPAIKSVVNIEPQQEINVPPVNLSADNLEEIWQAILKMLKGSTMPLFRDFGKLVELGDNYASVHLKSGGLLRISQAKIPELNEAFSRLLKRSISVKLEVLHHSGNLTENISISAETSKQITEITPPESFNDRSPEAHVPEAYFQPVNNITPIADFKARKNETKTEKEPVMERSENKPIVQTLIPTEDQEILNQIIETFHGELITDMSDISNSW